MGSAFRSLSGNQAKKVVLNGSPSEHFGPQSAKPGLFSAGEPASAFEGSTSVVAGTVPRRWIGNGGGRRWGPGVRSSSVAASLQKVSGVHHGETDVGDAQWDALGARQLVVQLAILAALKLLEQDDIVHRHGSHVSPLHSIICVLITVLLSLHTIHTRACLMHDEWRIRWETQKMGDVFLVYMGEQSQ